MILAHRICGLILLLLALACWLEGVRVWDEMGGTGFLPVILGGIFILLGLGFFKREPAERSQPFPWPNRKSWRHLGLALLIMFVYILTVRWVGYPVATVFFLTALLRFTGNVRWPLGIILGLLVAASTFFIFKIWLNMPLPAGLIGI